MSDEKPREFCLYIKNGKICPSPRMDTEAVPVIEYTAYKALLKERDALQKERDVLIEAIQIANKYFIKIIKGRYDCPHDNMAECALDEIKELEKMDHAKK